MSSIKKLFFFLFLLIVPITVFAKTEYTDIVAPITGTKVEENKINLYLFHGSTCPHCAEEREFLETIKKEYKDSVNFVYYEVWHDKVNAKYADAVKEALNITSGGVPLTVIGSDYYVGFNDANKESIKESLDKYITKTEKKESSKKVSLPLLGKVDLKKVSIPLVAIVLGLVDGFNPCAMWILLFLINMLFGMKNKKRMWALGISFLLTSGVVYFLSMLGLSIVLDMASIGWLRTMIALVALIAGILNIRNYIKERKQDGCKVVDEKKRSKIFTKINKFTHEKSFILALVGVIALAASVNLIELACSLGFPMVFSEILALNDITGIVRILYLMLYIILYLIDDIVVFIIAMVTLELTGISTKYNKIAHLIGGIVMIIMALLLLFKPGWLMFNF